MEPCALMFGGVDGMTALQAQNDAKKADAIRQDEDAKAFKAAAKEAKQLAAQRASAEKAKKAEERAEKVAHSAWKRHEKEARARVKEGTAAQSTQANGAGQRRKDNLHLKQLCKKRLKLQRRLSVAVPTVGKPIALQKLRLSMVLLPLMAEMRLMLLSRMS